MASTEWGVIIEEYSRTEPMDKVLFVSENLQGGSHTDDLISGMEEFYNVHLLNYTATYYSGGRPKLEKEIVDVVQTDNIRTIFINLGNALIIDIFFLKKLSEEFNVRLILILPDPEHNFEDQDRYYGQAVNFVWLNAPSMIPMFDLYGIDAIWTQGFDINRYPIKVKNKTVDVSFVGGIDRCNRSEYLLNLQKQGFRLEVAGVGSERGLVSVAEKNEIVYRSKINLNFTGVENNSRNIFNRVSQPKGRVMEVSMLGGFSLSEYSYGLEEMFDIGKEIDIFRSKKELSEKIRFYLKHNDLREKMAHRSYLRAMEKYESGNSFKKVYLHNESGITNERKDKKSYHLDKTFSRLFTGARIYYMVRFLAKWNFEAAVGELNPILKYRQFSLSNLYYDIPRAIWHTLKMERPTGMNSTIIRPHAGK